MHKHLVSLKSLFAFVMLSGSTLGALSAQAAEFKRVAGIGIDFGGETMASAVYTDGSSANVKANNGMVFNAGGVMINDQYETQLTVGYKFGGPFAKNGSVTWDTVPLELIQFLRTNNVRIGLGFSYHINPRLMVDLPGSNYTNNYENALGTIALIGWAPMHIPFSIDLRYTSIRYKQSNVSNPQENSGNVLGIYSSVYF
ncbi:MAG TPA: hypothetical protein VMV48_11225 [Gallionellaceae bacterium]|nr:hypothetical protein [Gallionellaceae bacterium]